MRALLALVLLVVVLTGCAGTAERQDAARPDPTTVARPATTASGTAGSDGTVPEETAGSTGLGTVTIDASGGERVGVRVEIVDDPVGRYIGLRYRESLPEDRGMLFVYTDEATRGFTMEDTLIPLSIAFMDAEGRIVDIQNMKPGTTGYESARPARYALEVNRGFFRERGVEVGDRAELPV